MRAYGVSRYGSNDLVKLFEVAKPSPGPGEVLIQVKAASVNPVDFKIRQGSLKQIFTYSFPLLLGNDSAGVIAEVGPGVTRFKKGDEVFSGADKDRLGTFAEFAIADEKSVALKPANLSFNDAAGVPLVGVTSWQALFDRGGLKAGQKVLILAGSGGVGSLAIQLAKTVDAYVATTTSTKNL